MHIQLFWFRCLRSHSLSMFDELHRHLRGYISSNINSILNHKDLLGTVSCVAVTVQLRSPLSNVQIECRGIGSCQFLSVDAPYLILSPLSVCKTLMVLSNRGYRRRPVTLTLTFSAITSP